MTVHVFHHAVIGSHEAVRMLMFVVVGCHSLGVIYNATSYKID